MRHLPLQRRIDYMMPDFSEAENIIGYKFKNIALLRNAFTHSSYKNEHKSDGTKLTEDNERLEFLGDSVLGFIVAKRLYGKTPKESAGDMTQEKQKLVSTVPLSNAMAVAGLGKFLLCGESVNKEKLPKSVLENLCECIIAAIYLDAGIDAAESFADKFVFGDQSSDEKKIVRDYKSALQIYTQSIKAGTPRYILVSKTGPDHDPKFTISVEIAGVRTAGSGKNKSEASQMAACRALKKITGRNK